MGYYVTADGEITVPAANVEAAYRAVCALNARHELKNGGQWPANETKPADSRSNGDPNKWFSWMAWHYDDTCATLTEVFTEVGFDTVTADNGDVIIGYFDSKTGNEGDFLDAVAPYAAPGVGHYWRGENGEQWRDTYENGKREERYGTVIYG